MEGKDSLGVWAWAGDQVSASEKYIETRCGDWVQVDGQFRSGRSPDLDAVSGDLIGTAGVLNSKYNASRDSLDLARDSLGCLCVSGICA